MPKCPARSFHNKAAEHIPEALFLPALGPILKQIGSLTQRIERIGGYERQPETISKESYPETELLRQVEGIGPLTALTFVLTIEDPYRFQKSRSVGAYLGLVPARDQSGDRDPQKRISKEGNEMLRKLLVSCAHYILGPFGSDSDLRPHGKKIASRGGKNSKKRAVVAVARKLAMLLYSRKLLTRVKQVGSSLAVSCIAPAGQGQKLPGSTGPAAQTLHVVVVNKVASR